MSLKKLVKRSLSLCVALALVLQLAACGYFMYPERRGQTDGKIDPSIAILDGLGLLLFIIPGVIAFAVDFSTGAIYLPGSASLDGPDDQYSDWAKLQIPEDKMTRDGVEDIIAQQTNIQDVLSQGNSSVFEVSSLDEAQMKLAYLSQ
jgi:hypothetical protein